MESNKYQSVEKDGQVLLVKSTEKDSIKTITKWMEAFHIFVAIYAEKNPQEICNKTELFVLMHSRKCLNYFFQKCLLVLWSVRHKAR